MPDPFGARAGQYTVELYTVATLKKWLPSEIVRAARRYAAMPGAIVNSATLETMLTTGVFPFTPGVSVMADFDDWPVDRLPHVQVLAPTWTPVDTDERGIAMLYSVQVACMVGASDQAHTRFIRAAFEDAIPVVMKQHQGLEGLPGAGGTEMLGGSAVEITDTKDARTLQAFTGSFEVLVHGVLNPRGGPSSPNPLPVVQPGDVPPPDADLPTVLVDGATVEFTAEEV